MKQAKSICRWENTRGKSEAGAMNIKAKCIALKNNI